MFHSVVCCDDIISLEIIQHTESKECEWGGMGGILTDQVICLYFTVQLSCWILRFQKRDSVRKNSILVCWDLPNSLQKCETKDPSWNLWVIFDWLKKYCKNNNIDTFPLFCLSQVPPKKVNIQILCFRPRTLRWKWAIKSNAPVLWC